MEVDGAYDWEEEVKKFEETKAGVKGLIDSGITKIPKFFTQPSEKCPEETPVCSVQFKVPVIDLQGVEDSVRRAEIIDEIREACETWGFFQMVNHGVPMNVSDALLEGTRRVHEQPLEAKMDLYSSDGWKPVRFYAINGSFGELDVASWRDVFACTYTDDALDPEAIPLVIRKEVQDYVNCMTKLRKTLSELISESLGLSSDYLEQIECMKSQYLTCLYYPSCPEPDKTFGTYSHTDPTFLTILVQDSIGGLQVLHQNQWLDVPPVREALIANVGDFMQIITNDKFKSAHHRVLARSTGTRISAACFLSPSSNSIFKEYGPIKELTSDDSPPIYREVSYLEYIGHHQTKIRCGTSDISYFKL